MNILYRQRHIFLTTVLETINLYIQMTLDSSPLMLIEFKFWKLVSYPIIMALILIFFHLSKEDALGFLISRLQKSLEDFKWFSKTLTAYQRLYETLWLLHQASNLHEISPKLERFQSLWQIARDFKPTRSKEEGKPPDFKWLVSLSDILKISTNFSQL
jgi:hypothetical protein